MSSQTSFVDRLRDVPFFNSLMGFFFNKGVRGGPRILLNLASVLLVLLLIAKLMPSRVAESALGSIPHDLWSGISGGSGADDGSVSGGLRIVVFGENDIGTPAGQDEEVEGAMSWTRALCVQVCLTRQKNVVLVPEPERRRTFVFDTRNSHSSSAARTSLWCPRQMPRHGLSAPTKSTPMVLRRSSTRLPISPPLAWTIHTFRHTTRRNGNRPTSKTRSINSWPCQSPAMPPERRSGYSPLAFGTCGRCQRCQTLLAQNP